MANIASQKKRILRSERERTENRLLTSTVKTHFRRLESAVESGDAASVATEHRALVSKVDKAVQKGALHRNTGARKKAKAARIAAGTANRRTRPLIHRNDDQDDDEQDDDDQRRGNDNLGLPAGERFIHLAGLRRDARELVALQRCNGTGGLAA